MPPATAWMRAGICSRTSTSRVRTVPRRVTTSGMTFSLVPPSITPDGEHRGLSRRDLPADDPLQGDDHVAGDEDGIDRAVGARGVRRPCR